MLSWGQDGICPLRINLRYMVRRSGEATEKFVAGQLFWNGAGEAILEFRRHDVREISVPKRIIHFDRMRRIAARCGVQARYICNNPITHERAASDRSVI